ncbi:MAG: tetratricopeptide repeat protein [Bryobacteraceae bacterium]
MPRVKLLALLPLLLLLGACSTDPHARAVRYVENGNKFFERDKFKEASIMYRRAIQANADPLYGEAYYRMGLTFMKLSDISSAYRSFLRAVELQKDNTDALMKTADIEILAAAQGGKGSEKFLGDAKERATKLLTMKGGTYDGYRMLGQIALLKKESADAVLNLEKANQAKPDQPALILAYFTALVQNDQFPQAESVAKALMAKHKDYATMYDLLYIQYATRKQFAEAEALLRLKTENNPNNSDFVLQLATHYASLREIAKMDQTMALLNDEKRFPTGHLSAGDFYYLRLREFDRAKGQYEAGLTAVPKDKATYQKRLVELYAATNRNDEANKILAQVLKDTPDDSEAVAMRAAMRLTTGNRDEVNLAVNDLQGLVSKTPGNHLLHFNLARALLAKGDVEPARLQLEETIKLRADFVQAHEFLARIYLSRNDATKALQESDTILKLDSKNLGGHLARSSALLLLQEKDKAREELDYVMKMYPQNADARYQVGFLAWQDKDYAKAAQLFGDLHKNSPKDIRGLVGVVETLAGQGNIAGAIKEMEAASNAEPDRRDLRIALGNLNVRGEHYEEAIKQYNAVLAKDPRAADVLFKLAETYRRKGDLNQAIDAFRKSSQAAPNDAGPLLQLGLLMDGTGRRDQSKPIYEQVLRIQQDHPVALNNLAFIKAEEGTDLDSALSMAQRAYQAAPGSPDITDTLGWVYIRKNLSQEAIRLFTDLVKKYPANPVYRLHYAMALKQKGDLPAAKRELEAALQNGPSKDEAAKIQELLRTL